jgi:YgiT-type zinc finger domain-containing protein
MGTERCESQWRELAEGVITGMTEWRRQHPQATLAEIETALDARLARLRAQMLQDAALATAATQWRQAPARERPACPACGTALVSRGRGRRHLETHGGVEITLERHYGVCPACQTGLFPPGSGTSAAAGPSDPAAAGATDPPGELDAV